MFIMRRTSSSEKSQHALPRSRNAKRLGTSWLVITDLARIQERFCSLTSKAGISTHLRARRTIYNVHGQRSLAFLVNCYPHITLSSISYFFMVSFTSLAAILLSTLATTQGSPTSKCTTIKSGQLKTSQYYSLLSSQMKDI